MKNYQPLIILQAVMLGALLFIAVRLDGEFGAASFWRFDLGLCGLAVVALLPGLFSGARRRAWSLLWAFNLAILLLPQTCLTPTKAFLQFHRQIRTGMTVGEVGRLYAASYPTHGYFSQPEINGDAVAGLRYSLDPSHDRVDCISIQFRSGRVVTSEYFGD